MTLTTANTALLPAADTLRQLNFHSVPPSAMLYRCALFNSSPDMTNAEKLNEYYTQIDIFRQAQANPDIEKISKSVEHVRSQGLLYQDFPEQNAVLLETILVLSLKLIHIPLIYTSESYFWFISEVYDIIFHQVNNMQEYPPAIAELYFELTSEVSDERFHLLYEEKFHSYKTCIYFILMYGWFASRKEEFIFLFNKLRLLFSDPPDHLEEWWIETYKTLNIN